MARIDRTAESILSLRAQSFIATQGGIDAVDVTQLTDHLMQSVRIDQRLQRGYYRDIAQRVHDAALIADSLEQGADISTRRYSLIRGLQGAEERYTWRVVVTEIGPDGLPAWDTAVWVSSDRPLSVAEIREQAMIAVMDDRSLDRDYRNRLTGDLSGRTYSQVIVLAGRSR